MKVVTKFLVGSLLIISGFTSALAVSPIITVEVIGQVTLVNHYSKALALTYVNNGYQNYVWPHYASINKNATETMQVKINDLLGAHIETYIHFQPLSASGAEQGYNAYLGILKKNSSAIAVDGYNSYGIAFSMTAGKDPIVTFCTHAVYEQYGYCP